MFGVICLIVTLIWPWSLFSISVLCSATSLAMPEDHPKVSKLAAGDWMLRSQVYYCTRGNPQLTSGWVLPPLSGCCGLCRPLHTAHRSLMLAGQHFVLQGPGSEQDMALWCSGCPLSCLGNDSDSVSLPHQRVWFRGERLFLNLFKLCLFFTSLILRTNLPNISE